MSTTSTAAHRRLDPDALAALEEQRNFLLRSLDDLERERAAGDLGEQDYAALVDDYTARAAAVLRRIDERTSPPPPTTGPPRRSGRTAVGVVLVVVVAVVAGALVAQASGRREAGDTLTGGIRETTRAQLADCQAALGRSELLPAIECYDEVLADDPDNPEALTYRGWALVLTGDDRLVPTGIDYLEQATEADPVFLDARVFRAIVFDRQGRAEDARAELDVVYANDPPPVITDLADPLRERLAVQTEAEEGSP